MKKLGRQDDPHRKLYSGEDASDSCAGSKLAVSWYVSCLAAQTVGLWDD